MSLFYTILSTLYVFFVGMVPYDDYEQVAIADLPGLIPGSHKNYGLGEYLLVSCVVSTYAIKKLIIFQLLSKYWIVPIFENYVKPSVATSSIIEMKNEMK